MFKIGDVVQLKSVLEDDGNPGVVVNLDLPYIIVRWKLNNYDSSHEINSLRLIRDDSEVPKVSKEAILNYMKNLSRNSYSSDMSAMWNNVIETIEDYFYEFVKEDEKLEDPDYKQYLKLKQRFEGNE